MSTPQNTPNTPQQQGQQDNELNAAEIQSALADISKSLQQIAEKLNK